LACGLFGRETGTVETLLEMHVQQRVLFG
jgi:hypothetical protein